MEGQAPATIAKQHGLHREAVRRCILVGEKAGVLQRVPGTKSPALYEPGSNASALLSGWPTRPSRSQGGGPSPAKPMRVHSVNYRVELIARPEAGKPDLPWKEASKWGRCRQWSCAIQVDEVGLIRLRLIGSKTMAIFTPSFRAGRAEMETMLDVLYLRIQAVLSVITRNYGYRFGPIRLHTKPEWAFPVDSDGIKRLLATCKPKTKLWWADASPESGGAEVETGSYAEAVKYLEMPERVARLEQQMAEVLKLQRSDHGALEKLTGVVESLMRNQMENHESTMSHLSRLTWMMQELTKRMEQPTKGPKEN